MLRWVCVVFRILELIVMEGVFVPLTLGGAENDRPLFCGEGGGNGPARSAPPPQLGECLRIWRAYLLSGRCMIAVCVQPPPRGVRVGFDHPKSRPRTHRPLRIFRNGSLGKWKAHWPPFFSVELNAKSTASQCHGVWKGIPVGVNFVRFLQSSFVSWDIPGGLR